MATSAPQPGTNLKNKIRSLLAQIDSPEAAVILLVVPILLTVWVYFGRHTATAAWLASLNLPVGTDVATTLFEWLSAFVLMFAVPALIAKIGFKRSWRDLGVQPGKVREGLKWAAVIVPLMLLSAYLGSFDPAMQAEYPLARSAAASSLPLFFVIEIGYLVYYFSWEFLFRGYMLFGLEKKFGALFAILIQTIPSAIVHIGKPFNESFSAILAGLLFGLVAIRTRSIFWPMLLHAVVGLGTDLFMLHYVIH